MSRLFWKKHPLKKEILSVHPKKLTKMYIKHIEYLKIETINIESSRDLINALVLNLFQFKTHIHVKWWVLFIRNIRSLLIICNNALLVIHVTSTIFVLWNKIIKIPSVRHAFSLNRETGISHQTDISIPGFHTLIYRIKF